jgi:Domain of unknown function (DUF4349)
MNRVSCRLGRTWLMLAIAGIAVLGVLTAVDVTFVAEQIGGPAPQQYEGFTGQIERGWDALVSVLGNLVLLFGLLLPWLGVLAVAAGILYGIIRLARARRS